MPKSRPLALGALALTLWLVACTGAPPTPTAPPAPSAPSPAPAAPSPAAPSPAPIAASPSPAGSPAAVSSPAVAASPAASPSPSPSPSPAAAAPAASTGPKPTVRVGSMNFSESVLLAELYGQALEGNGYPIERRLNLGNREIVYPALESGQLDMYPEYLSTSLAFVTKGEVKGSTDPAVTQRSLQEALRPKGISILDYAPAVDENGFVVTKATADKYKLAKLSDLAPVANQLVLGGPPECPERPFCAPGLKDTYGITFKDFKPLDAGGPLTVAALEGNQIDVALLFTTDPLIVSRGFVLLDDDKKLQLSDNVAPIVRDDLLSRAPADFRTLLNSVSSKLTTQELTDLNKQVGIDRKESRDVAAAWLKAKGVVR